MHVIDTVFFDIGGTLRGVVKDPEQCERAEWELYRLIGATGPKDELIETIKKRYKAYRANSNITNLEDDQMELWRNWLLPDYDAELIGSNPNRDVEGTFRSGFGAMILFEEEGEPDAPKPADAGDCAWYVAHSLTDLLDIFPPLEGRTRD